MPPPMMKRSVGVMLFPSSWSFIFVYARLCCKRTFSRIRWQRGWAMNFRQAEILELLRSEGRVAVEELAARFAVTVQTIRRDLTELAEAGHLDRVHGGAVARTGVANIGYDERRRMNEAAKAAIARACAAEIPDNSLDHPEPWHHDRGGGARIAGASRDYGGDE